jgi:hypothetical protein
MRITAEPRSDQYNADDLVAGPRTFTIAGVKPGKAEQKYDIALEGEERVWRPPLTVLRLMLAAWGDEASAWVGQRVTLFRDPKVSFGSDAVGGIRISHMTGIDKPLVEELTVKRGKRGRFTVQPLKDAPVATHPTAEQVAECTDIDRLRGWWAKADAATKALITARVAELTPTPAEKQGELVQ